MLDIFLVSLVIRVVEGFILYPLLIESGERVLGGPSRRGP